ncbi:DUF6895 family protein [Dictyobacter formicarum]|uniref:DUF6895 domain-containing protein n=1 Tax=Dictyobacter formicarum TaxID=2778368 RepID=A0ABQ3VAH8_9CHLR|nr:hypothetical protein [Dictyobacter formicarum]GHO83150.1 hypothetical protein KSZ_11560 [Dictyobacter formicarum]
MAEKFEQIYLCYDHALDWLDEHRELFNPLTDKSDNPSADIYLTKALGELGLLCMLYYRSKEGDVEPRIQHFLQLIFGVWQQPQYQERIIRRPEYFQIYTMIYIVLQQCNVITEDYKELIQLVIDQRYVTATETTPMRLLDRRHMLDCGQFHHSLPSYEQLYHNTLLAQTPELAYLTDTDVYAVTHTLFYLTDFGRSSSPILQGDHLATIQWSIETLLGLYLRNKNWDLVGELLLDCYCLHWYPGTVFDLAWETIRKHQLPDGSIPGPRYSQEQRDKLDSTASIHYCFEENYHTTIVNAITSFLTYQDLKMSASAK